VKLRSSHLGTAVLVILLALALVGVLAPVFGWRLDVVQSGSMTPSIGVGDLLVTAPCEPGDLRVGDVISFHSEGGAMVCHRIVAVDEVNRTFTVKGDANQHSDPAPVPFDNVVGKVSGNVPLMGYVISFLKSPFGWALIILVALLVLVLGSGKRPAKNEAVTAPAEEGK
jgi:signal peptidase I